MNYGEGQEQAAREWGILLHAESVGATREWTRSFVQDIRQSGIKDALANQFDNVADRFINKLIDGLFDLKIGGSGNWLSQGLNFLFGKNANGTEFWEGGPTWVGERGPELLWAPRGASISDADRSKRLAAVRGGSGSGAAPVIRLGDTIIHAEGADATGLARVEKAVRDLNRSVESRAVAAVADWQERSFGMA